MHDILVLCSLVLLTVVFLFGTVVIQNHIAKADYLAKKQALQKVPKLCCDNLNNSIASPWSDLKPLIHLERCYIPFPAVANAAPERAAKRWNESNDFCKSLGGRLGTVNSKFLLGALVKAFPEQNFFHVGLRQANNSFDPREGWRWDADPDTPFNQDLWWNQGEPDDSGGRIPESCAVARFNPVGGPALHDVPCGQMTAGFICHWQRNNITC